MNIRELFFRIYQQFSHQFNRKNRGLSVKINDAFKIKDAILSPEVFSEPLDSYIQIFEIKIDYSKILNWHLDLSTGKEFPKKYAFDIDIRTDKNGSAKYVWEVNRMLFLPRIAINYKQHGQSNDIEMFIKHIKTWKEQNPYLEGVNWYSNIEVNIRLINWALCWEIIDATKLMQNNIDFKRFVEEDWLPLIYQHCIYSASFPSLFSSANNHLISEYAGLFIANCLWEFPESKQWLAESQSGLENEILNQHTEEGVNKEEAAEYIQFITDFFLLSYVFGEKSNHDFSVNFKNRLILIFDYIHGFLDIKGNFPQYGDEDDGRLILLNKELHASNFDSILISAAIITRNSKYKLPRLRIDNKNLILFGTEGRKIFESLKPQKTAKSTFFPKSGHFIFRKIEAEKEIYLHFDVASLGYLSIAAHGHSDALSVILHVDGNQILVDSGTFTYHTHPEWRSYFIGTKAHNTVSINNKNQSINGGPLLWLKHCNSEVEGYNMGNESEWVVGNHDGYNDLGYKHRRKVAFETDTQVFTIVDTIISNTQTEVLIELPWHLHPACNASFDGQKYIIERDGARNVSITIDKKLNTEIITGKTNPIMGWYSESFYKKQSTQVILGKTFTSIAEEIIFITTIEIK